MTTFPAQHLGAFHLAYLDVTMGVGMLVLPRSEENVWLGADSVHGADWDTAIKQLDRLGWEPLTDEWDLPMLEGMTADGREVVALHGRDPIVSQPALTDLIARTAALRAAVLAPAA
jgi:hypothetical protein